MKNNYQIIIRNMKLLHKNTINICFKKSKLLFKKYY